MANYLNLSTNRANVPTVMLDFSAINYLKRLQTVYRGPASPPKFPDS